MKFNTSFDPYCTKHISDHQLLDTIKVETLQSRAYDNVEDDLLALQIMLLKDPQSGPVKEGSGGIWKVRFPLENRGKSGNILKKLVKALKDEAAKNRKKYSNKEIKAIRRKAGMTQTVFANCMRVSKKTVEVWELGRTRPTGPAYRLLNILDQGKENELAFVSVNKFDQKNSFRSKNFIL